MTPQWQLTGRGEELQFIEAALLRKAGPRGVVLAGPAGVGKTRLAREALARVERRGAATRWVVATASARPLPLGAFTALQGAVGGDPARLMRQATDALLSGAGASGVVLGVDDAHLLDEMSALLVHQLAQRDDAMLLVTIRAGEPAPDAVTALWKDGQLPRLEIQPLSEQETAALLDAVLGGPVDSSGARHLWRLTGGNALFLRHLVDGELEAGRLRQVRGVWCWPGHAAVSPLLAEVVEARMGQLTGPVRDVIDVLALAEPLGITLLAALTDPGAVEHAEERGVVSVERDGRRLQARIAHPLYGEVRRARMGELRARRLRGRIATALVNTGARRADDTLRCAALTVESDLRPDPTMLTEAANTAANMLDFPLAERLSRGAVAAGADSRHNLQ